MRTIPFSARSWVHLTLMGQSVERGWHCVPDRVVVYNSFTEKGPLPSENDYAVCDFYQLTCVLLSRMEPLGSWHSYTYLTHEVAMFQESLALNKIICKICMILKNV